MNASELGVLPTGTVTLLLADVEDSEQLRAAEPQRWAGAMAGVDRALAQVTDAHGGVRPGEPVDGGMFVAAFGSAGDALAGAVALQQAPLAPIRLRIAVHTGDVPPCNQGSYAASIINRAAGLCEVAHGGQTVLSAATVPLVADRLPADVWLSDLGAYRLPGGLHVERVVQLCHRDLVNDFPPLRARASAGRHLPVQLTSFVGREAELTALRRLVCDNRLVTLTGPGGMGKTRLALQLGGELVDRFTDGVWCVDLAPITDPDLIGMRVARTLGLADQPGNSAVDTLARFIGDRRLLMVLDNCEHLLDACAPLLTALLGGCAGLRVIATSREPLGVSGEVTWLTPSLSLAGEAVELFTQRARLVWPDFAVGDDGVALVAEICRRLDGVPLAIELAATRVRALSLTEIIDGLDDRFRLLTGGARAALPRHQTLRASVDWSHALLSEPEQVVFRRLAVFLGGFDLDGAHAVAGGTGASRYQSADDLAALVGKSLVVADNTAPTTRYRMLETVRQYALEKLAAAGETDAVRARHRDHYTQVFDSPMSAGLQQRVEQAEAEIDNLRAAFAHSRGHGDIELAARLASSLQPLWMRGRIQEGLGWFDAVLADSVATAPAARVRALADKVVLATVAGTYYLVQQSEEAVAIAREIDDPALLAWALAACGFTCCYSPDVALPYFAQAIELAPALGDDWRMSQIFGTQAYSAFVAGNPAAVRPAAEHGRDLADAIGDGMVSRQCRWSIGLAQWLTADLAQATARFSEVAVEAQAAHDPMFSACGLMLQGITLAYQGDTGGARAAAEASVRVAADLAAFPRATSLGALVDALLAAGDVPAALVAGDAARDACGLPQLLAINGNPLAKAALASGDAVAARRSVDETISVASGAHRMILLATRVRVAIAQGEGEQAEDDARAALAIAAETRAYLSIPDVIECLATLATDSGSHRDAARLFGSAQAVRERTGQVRFKIYDDDYDAALRTLREAMTPQDFDTGWTEGAAMPADEAIAYILRGHGPRKRPPAGWESLTPTERDVARLVGDGLSNKEIGTRLFISPRTVQTHLTHVYSKLEFSSRIQLAQEAARHV